MKKLIILLVISQLYIKVDAQSWQWAKGAGSTSIDEAFDMCLDSDDNVYIVGKFGFWNIWTGYMIFDNDTVYNSGVNQIYIAKYSSTGNVVWAKGIGANNVNLGNCDNCEAAYAVSYDSFSNSIYMTGKIYGTAIFGDTILSGSGACFLTKMDLDGTFIWTELITSNPNSVSAPALTTDSIGSIYIAGHCKEDSISFDSIKIAKGGFIARYTTDGMCLWAKRKFIDATPKSIKIFHGDLFICGGTINDTAFIDTSVIYSTVIQNFLLARFDSSANIIWLKTAISNGGSSTNELGMDTLGNCYLAGAFQNNIDFGSQNFNTSNLVDIFFAKYDEYSNFQWAKQSNSTSLASSAKVTSKVNGYSYLLGDFLGDITFDSYTINSSTGNIFIARFNENGTCLGIDNFGNASCYTITADNNDDYYLAGSFGGTLALGSTTLTSYGTTDAFLAKHDAITGGISERADLNNQLIIYANPNAGKCNITVPDEFQHERKLMLSIFNNEGKLIQQKILEMNEGKIKVSLEAEANGIYNAILSNGSKAYSGKIVFE
jgi:hypothetical protein